MLGLGSTPPLGQSLAARPRARRPKMAWCSFRVWGTFRCLDCSFPTEKVHCWMWQLFCRNHLPDIIQTCLWELCDPGIPTLAWVLENPCEGGLINWHYCQKDQISSILICSKYLCTHISSNNLSENTALVNKHSKVWPAKPVSLRCKHLWHKITKNCGSHAKM